MCLGRLPIEAEDKAAEVMQANGVDSAAISDDDITFEGEPPYIINIVARHPALSPIVGQLVGWGVIDVGATASAACGAAMSACGIWPVALSGSAWQEIQPAEDEPCEERKIAIWHDDLPDKDYDDKTPQCWIGGKQQADLCDCYECPDDLLLMSTSGRGWLDFSQFVIDDPLDPLDDSCFSEFGGGGTAALKCQISRNSAVKIGNLPQCVDGITGVRASTKLPIDDRKGQIVKVPLYESMECKVSNKPSYKVSSFACMEVEGWVKLMDKDAFGLKENIKIKDEYKNEPWALKRQDIQKTEKVILVRMNCDGCTTACGSTDGSNAGYGGLRAANLIK